MIYIYFLCIKHYILFETQMRCTSSTAGGRHFMESGSFFNAKTILFPESTKKNFLAHSLTAFKIYKHEIGRSDYLINLESNNLFFPTTWIISDCCNMMTSSLELSSLRLLYASHLFEMQTLQHFLKKRLCLYQKIENNVRLFNYYYYQEKPFKRRTYRNKVGEIIQIFQNTEL